MNNSTYDIEDFGDFAVKQGIYVFKSNTQLINGPEGSIIGPCTLQVFYNSADPVDDNIYAQQILYYAGKTYMRTCYWWQTSSTQYQTEWGEWETYEPSDVYTNRFVNANWFNGRYKRMGTMVLTFNAGTARATFATFGVTTRPDVMLLTCQSQNTWMRYDFDSSASSITILCGGGVSGAIRFCYLEGMNY